MIYSSVAIDYSVGIDIYDPVNGKVYKPEEAIILSEEIKSRLINKPRKIGCWVHTNEELEEILKERRKKWVVQ